MFNKYFLSLPTNSVYGLTHFLSILESYPSLFLFVSITKKKKKKKETVSSQIPVTNISIKYLLFKNTGIYIEAMIPELECIICWDERTFT